MDLAACYRPESFIGCEEVNPRLLPLSSRCQPLAVIPHYDLSTQVQMSSAYPLPSAYPDCGSQEDLPLAFSIPHFRVSLRCPIRSLFRIVGSSSRIDGDIVTSLLSITALMYDFVSHGVPWKNLQKWPVFNLARAITQSYVVFFPKV